MTIARDLTPIVAKLERLIPRLASNHDGEVLATARAIVRVLHAGERDLHDLAATIASLASATRDDEPATTVWRDKAERLLRRQADLTARETEFLRSILRFRRLSSKQRAWLDGIAAKVRRRGHAS